jgi:hydrogenase-4 component B
MSCNLLLISAALYAISGVPSLLISRKSRRGQWAATWMNLLASAIGFAEIAVHTAGATRSEFNGVSWPLALGRFAIGLDNIGVIFLIPIFLVSSVGSIYGMEYWNQVKRPRSGAKVRLFWGLLNAGMVLVITARNAGLFLMAWEIMAVSAYFLITAEDSDPAARRAGWIYLAATHTGTMALFAFFAILKRTSGSFDLWPTLRHIGPHFSEALFVLGLIGFGAKAGIVPLHLWLPGAHANAPSHVSALLSGVMLKMGIYGLVRVGMLMPNPPLWWGATLLSAGTLTGILGIGWAIGQGDFKRLLAYSSIENMGIITMGLGLALLGRATGHADWVALGMGGALLHVINHSLFKPLLFMGAGNILHTVRTRQIDQLGGLGKTMPRTLVLFAIGAIAICGLPPLNGFVSELMIYLGLLHLATASLGNIGWVAIAAPALAVIGALAVASFVKLIGIAFLGTPRTARAASAHDPNRAMLGPMAVLAGGCLLVGTLPIATAGILERAIADWSANIVSLGSYVPFAWITAVAIGLGIIIALLSARVFASPGRAADRTAGTWGCGYVRPTSRIQYTASSFAQTLVDQLAWATWQRQRKPAIATAFPAPSEFASELPDPILDRGVLPASALAERFLGLARVFVRGRIQVYLLYVAAIVVLLMLMK